MPNTATTRFKLIKPAVGADYPALVDAWIDTIDASVLGGLLVAPTAVDLTSGASTSLFVNVTDGTYEKSDGTIQTYAGSSSNAVAASTTNFVYLDDSGTVNINTTGFPTGSNYIPLAQVVTNSTIVTSILDCRFFARSVGKLRTLTSAINTTASWTIDATKAVNFSNYSSGAITATLPAANTVPPGTTFVVMDYAGNAGTHNITITRSGSDTINGGSTFVISTNYGGARLWCDGSSVWLVLP